MNIELRCTKSFHRAPFTKGRLYEVTHVEANGTRYEVIDNLGYPWTVHVNGLTIEFLRGTVEFEVAYE